MKVFDFRSASAASKVAEMFSNRTISKHYWAVTVGIPTSEEGEINIPIGEAKLLGGYRIVTRPDLTGRSSEVWECAVPEIIYTDSPQMDWNFLGMRGFCKIKN